MENFTVTPVQTPVAFKERDIFKLAILGHAAVEDAIDRRITEGFGGSTPPELRRLGFRTRLALLSALTPLPKRYLKPMNALAKVRHDFAHGRIIELSSERAEALQAEFLPLGEELDDMFERANAPRLILAACLVIAYCAVEISGQVAQHRRSTERRALTIQAEMRRLLDSH